MLTKLGLLLLAVTFTLAIGACGPKRTETKPDYDKVRQNADAANQNLNEEEDRQAERDQ